MLTMQTKPEITVKEIDKATSPLAKWVNKFECAPPGQDATKTKPTAKAGVRPKIKAVKKAKAGNKTICPVTPMMVALGCVNIALKSSLTKPKPIASVIMASEPGKKYVTAICVIMSCIIWPRIS